MSEWYGLLDHIEPDKIANLQLMSLSMDFGGATPENEFIKII